MTDKTAKEVNQPLTKPLAIVAGILGLIQGIAWALGSILCICCYYGSIQEDLSQASGNLTYYQLIYTIFLHDSDANLVSSSSIITPGDFFIFMWFYVIFSTVWTITSATILWAMIHDKWNVAKCLFGTWSAVTILTSIVDIVLTGLLVSDYITNSGGITQVSVCYGIVMSLAARGYLLWVINVIFAAILIKFTVDIVMGENKDTTMPIIHGYESNYDNPPWFNDNAKDFWASSPQQTTTETDKGYDNRGFERSQSFFTPPMANQNTYSPAPHNLYPTNSNGTYPTPVNAYSSVPSNQYYGIPNNNMAPQNNRIPNNNPTSFTEAIVNRTATIGRNKGRRSPPNNIPPPSIPAPDYTPPGSPNALKSVLRSKSNYNRAVY